MKPAGHSSFVLLTVIIDSQVEFELLELEAAVFRLDIT